MNYIRHLNAVMEKFAVDNRLNPNHISLYMGLFALWNMARFNNPIFIDREETMQLSKIGSRNTYTKCLKDLTAYGYISYKPSHHPLKGSQVYLLRFDNSSEQVTDHSLRKSDKSSVKALSPYIKHNKQVTNSKERETEFNPPSLDEIENFLKKIIQDSGLNIDAEIESKKYHNYYTSKGWRVGNTQMKDWQAAAENWIIKTQEYHAATRQSQSHLHTETDKDYGEPL